MVRLQARVQHNETKRPNHEGLSVTMHRDNDIRFSLIFSMASGQQARESTSRRSKQVQPQRFPITVKGADFYARRGDSSGPKTGEA
jgi:hypothetical protein